MVKNTAPIITFLLSIVLNVSCCASISFAQSSAETPLQILQSRAGFSTEDLHLLEQEGQVLTRLLPARDQREIAVCGAIRLTLSPEMFGQKYREYMTTPDSISTIERGQFSKPPSLSDIQSLTIESRDLQDLKQCEIGHCELRLSAPMIQRFRREIDSNASDYPRQATELYRRMLVDYVQDYSGHGKSALIKYNDQNTVVNLDDEFRDLLTTRPSINDFAPEFSDYLQGEKGALPGLESFLYWSKFKFGLKPVTAINDVIMYPRKIGNLSEILIASNQIYASHYFDSSFTVTALISSESDATHAGSYLFYLNRSRSASLRGFRGKMVRPVVENEALGELKTNLRLMKARFEGERIKPQPDVPEQTMWVKFISILALTGLLLGLVSLFVRQYLQKLK